MAAERIRVDGSKTIRSFAASPLGINVNYLMDSSARKPADKSLAGALKEMGVHFLRYPGGEKSDSVLWSVPPYDKPAPVLARTGPEEWLCTSWLVEPDYATFKHPVMDFDEFIALCRQVGAEPMVVVAYDSFAKPVGRGGTAPTRDQLLETAAAWVHYANVTKEYGVKYWEIGNESYLDSYNGCVTAEEYARDFSEFSQAMKRIDPDILIGANGPNGRNAAGAKNVDAGAGWWKTVLESAAKHIDFMAIHNYPCFDWKEYDHYRRHTPNLNEALDEAAHALAAWCPEDASRIRIMVTEMNSADWFGHPENSGWKHINTMGHALVLFDILGEHLKHPLTDAIVLWNTRWIYNEQKEIPELWDALDPQNRENPTGTALGIWGRFWGNRLFEASGTAAVKAFANEDPERGTIHIFLINKETAALPVEVEPVGETSETRIWQWTGQDSEDTAPVWSETQLASMDGELLALTLPACSLTVIALNAKVGRRNSR